MCAMRQENKKEETVLLMMRKFHMEKSFCVYGFSFGWRFSASSNINELIIRFTFYACLIHMCLSGSISVDRITFNFPLGV